MILDVIDNYSIYSEVNPEIKKSLEFLSNGKFEDKESGRYDLDNGIYYMVQEIQSRAEHEVFFEAHRKYIDIQFLISGEELHGYAPLSTMKIRDPYDDEKDIAFYNGTGSVLSLSPGSFVIYFPSDAHKPALMIHKPMMVKKIVVKIPV